MTAISSPSHQGRRDPDQPEGAGGTSRRSFLGFVLAGTTLAVAVDLSAGATPG